MSQLQRKSLLIDPSNILHFNVGNENIHMKKVKSTLNNHYLSEQSKSQSASSHMLSVTNQRIYYSVVQKQSQSGVSFNNRLFFVKDEDLFGYMSKLDFQFDIKQAKQVVSLKNLRKVIPKGKILTLIYDLKSLTAKQTDKLIEKKWVLRMKNKKMVDSWTDIINYQVGQIPSRKNTVQNQLSSEQLPRSRKQTAEKDKQKIQQIKKIQKELQTMSISRNEEPIANERPELDYLSVWRNSPDKKREQSIKIVPQSINTLPKVYSSIQSPSKKDKLSDDKIQFSPQNLAARTYEKQPQNIYNSTSEKHSQKKQRYLSLQNNFPYQSELIASKSHYQQLQQSFRIQNKQIKQKIISPSFLNYFRPYLDESNLQSQLNASGRKSMNLHPHSSINKKFQDFVTYCQLTAKQLIDNQIPLSEFRLCNRYLYERQNISKQRLFKEMAQQHKQLIGKQVQSSRIELQALLLLFQNLLYISLQDVDLIVPLAELKNLPSIAEFNLQNLSSTNKICQNSLMTQFQNKETNLQFVYQQILKDETLKKYFFVPMSCQVQYKGFKIFFKTKVDENMFKATNTYDYQHQIQSLNASRLNSKEGSQNFMESLHQNLAKALFVQPQVIEDQNFVKITTLKPKGSSKFSILSNIEKKKCKFVIQYSDILPYIKPNEVIDPRVFIKIHEQVILNVENGSLNHQNISQKKSLVQESLHLSSTFMDRKHQTYSNKKQASKIRLYNHLGSLKQNQVQLKQYRQKTDNAIKQISQALSRFQISLIHPLELSQLLEEFELSHFSLGRVQQQISGKNSYIRSLIKSQIAAQCVKTILFKKLQQIILSQAYNQQLKQTLRGDLITKDITTLLNLILGKLAVKQTEMIWKVLTLHSQILYSCSITREQIHKGYFMLALVYKLNILINPNSGTIEDIFQTDKFVANVKFRNYRSKPAQLTTQFLLEIEGSDFSTLLKRSQTLFGQLMRFFQLDINPIPYFMRKSKHLNTKILYVLSRYITPFDTKYSHLPIYETKQLNFSQIHSGFSLLQDKNEIFTFDIPSIKTEIQLNSKRQSFEDNFGLYYKRKLRELSHKINQKVAFNFQPQIETMVKQIKVFYEFHPVISDFLDFMAAAYLQTQEYSKALQSTKKSLSNMISVCEGNSNHIRLANCFFNTALVYQKMRKFDDALNQFKRSKHCLETNRQLSSVFYAILLTKIAKISLFMQGKDQEALSNATSAQKVLEQQHLLYENIELLVQVYETTHQILLSSQISKNLLKNTEILSSQQLSEHYFQMLELLLKKEQEDKQKFNYKRQLITVQIFKRFLKLILPHYFHSLDEKGAEMFMAYTCELCESIAKKGGVNYGTQETHPLMQDTAALMHINMQKQLMVSVYPYQSKRFVSSSQQNSVYNIYEALKYIKQQIFKGSFILQMISYVEKTQQILNLIRQQIKQSKSNGSPSRSQSRSSSRMYLMSTNGLDFVRDRDYNEDNETIQLHKLLNSQHENGSNSQVQGYSRRERDFDSLMRALIVVLGDGFMTHIFEE